MIKERPVHLESVRGGRLADPREDWNTSVSEYRDALWDSDPGIYFFHLNQGCSEEGNY